MQPDTKNTWMDADLGKQDFLPPPVPIGGEPRAKPNVAAANDFAFALTRIVFSLLFAGHGAQKLFGILGGQQTHEPLMLIAGSLEFVGGMAVALGIFTRRMAFLLCGEMAVAYFKVHFADNVWPIGTSGEVAVLYCFFFLYVSMRGAGALSVEALRRKA